MKFFIAAVAVLAVVGTIESYSVEQKTRSLTKRSTEIIKKLKDKKIKDAVDELDLDDKFFEEFNEYCPNQEQPLKDAYKQLEKCVDQINDDITVCEAIETGLKNCTKTLTQVLDNCLPTASKGLPDMVIKSIASLVKHSCSVSGETNLEMVNPCFYNDLEESSEEDDALEVSVSEVIAQKVTFPTKDDVCKFVTGARQGIQDHLKANCKNQKTKDAFNGFYEALIVPCNALTEKA